MAKKSLKQYKEEIKAMLATNDKALVIAIIRIYERQTADEQRAGTTEEDNGIGFNGVDAELMTSFAVQIIQRKALFDKGFIPLSPKQLTYARKAMGKYAGQLARIAKAKAEAKEAIASSEEK